MQYPNPTINIKPNKEKFLNLKLKGKKNLQIIKTKP